MINITRTAQKELDVLPRNKRDLIVSKIKQLHVDPASLANNIKKLKGRGDYRLRVGDYRVIYNNKGLILRILRIAPRGGVYD